MPWSLKEDLQLRPFSHQFENRIEAHIFVAFMIYCRHISLQVRLCPLAAGLTARSGMDKFSTTDSRTFNVGRYTESNTCHKFLYEELVLSYPPQRPPAILATGALMH